MTLNNKRILVTGGSGSLGRWIIKELLTYPVKEIISLSRDEGLIKEAEQEIASDKVSFELGDVCDVKRVEKIMDGVSHVYHTAALKHVGLSEKFPREVLKINILGLLSLLDNSKKIARFVNISSDKAIGPANCYGSSKLFAEYLVKETNGYFPGKFINIRCPNFLGSRGSVIDLWKMQLLKNNTISVTDPEMTRYYISLHDASKYVVKTSLREDLNPDKCYYPQKKVAKFRLNELAKAFVQVFGNEKTKINVIGALPGEKRYEDYLCEVELSTVSDLKRKLTQL